MRRLFYHYFDLNKQASRFKNKLKATYRQVGEPAQGDGIYAKEGRERWLKVLEQRRTQTLERTVRAAIKWDGRSYELLESVPGVGQVIASGYMAVIVHPGPLLQGEQALALRRAW